MSSRKDPHGKRLFDHLVKPPSFGITQQETYGGAVRRDAFGHETYVSGYPTRIVLREHDPKSQIGGHTIVASVSYQQPDIGPEAWPILPLLSQAQAKAVRTLLHDVEHDLLTIPQIQSLRGLVQSLDAASLQGGAYDAITGARDPQHLPTVDTYTLDQKEAVDTIIREFGNKQLEPLYRLLEVLEYSCELGRPGHPLIPLDDGTATHRTMQTPFAPLPEVGAGYYFPQPTMPPMRPANTAQRCDAQAHQHYAGLLSKLPLPQSIRLTTFTHPPEGAQVSTKLSYSGAEAADFFLSNPTETNALRTVMESFDAEQLKQLGEEALAIHERRMADEDIVVPARVTTRNKEQQDAVDVLLGITHLNALSELTAILAKSKEPGASPIEIIEASIPPRKTQHPRINPGDPEASKGR